MGSNPIKTCNKCKLDKDLSEFNKRKSSKDGLDGYCRDCKIKYFPSIKYRETWKEYYLKNAEKIKEYARTYAKENKEKRKKRDLMKFYGITIEDFHKLEKRQNNKCAICGQVNSDGKLYIDHCHNTGKVRGLLCLYCNTGIGYFRDNIEFLLKAMNYLRNGE